MITIAPPTTVAMRRQWPTTRLDLSWSITATATLLPGTLRGMLRGSTSYVIMEGPLMRRAIMPCGIMPATTKSTVAGTTIDNGCGLDRRAAPLGASSHPKVRGEKTMKHKVHLVLLMAAALMMYGAQALAQSATTEAAIGGALGGATGAVIGQQVGGREGAILGGAVGAAAGTAIAVDKDRDGHRHHSVGGSAPAVIVAPPARGGFCPPGQAKKGNC